MTRLQRQLEKQTREIEQQFRQGLAAAGRIGARVPIEHEAELIDAQDGNELVIVESENLDDTVSDDYDALEEASIDTAPQGGGIPGGG
jgi:hypothetical protein